MKTTLILATITLALGAGPAASGPCGTEIDTLTKTLAAKDAGSGPTAGTTGSTASTGSTQGQHPPTGIMKQQTEGKAASPEDVRRQTAGQPPAAQQGAGGGAGTDSMRAGNALERARVLDRDGKETECMEAVREARQLSGTR